MQSLIHLRQIAREIFDHALRSVDPAAAVRRKVVLSGSLLIISEVETDLGTRNVYSIAIGKAGLAMASALEEVLGERLAGGIVTAGQIVPPAGLRHKIFRGGHPEPDEESLAAASATFDLLKTANEERALVIFSVSGGGSAMIEFPINDEITLDDLRLAHGALIKSGASISEINAVRRSFSAVKGGGLASRAAQCEQHTLWISDVPLGDERSIASGPTILPSKEEPNPLEVIERHNLGSLIPERILREVKHQTPLPRPAPMAQQMFYLLLDNKDALKEAKFAAHQKGFGGTSHIYPSLADLPIDQGTHLLKQQLDRMTENNRGHAVCLLSGGEFSCPVKGTGIGGRNLETALRLALEFEADNTDTTFVALCAGTDGIDGNSPAAGAIVDSTTIERARRIGLDPADFLNRSDSYSFFVALGDAITTGPTGTNVRDLRVLLAGRM